MRNYEEYTAEDWGKLDGEDWSWLLREQPQLAEHCDWGKLNGWDWSCLLSEQPQLAPHCDWGKLDGEDWSWLLHVQPQLAKYRSMEMKITKVTKTYFKPKASGFTSLNRLMRK